MVSTLYASLFPQCGEAVADQRVRGSKVMEAEGENENISFFNYMVMVFLKKKTYQDKYLVWIKLKV